LASGSEDSTVRIWDLDDLQCKATFAGIHKDKVQVVKWNSINDKILMSAGYDSKVNILDVRDKESKIKIKIPKLSKDIESGVWHPTLEHNFAISTESGIVYGYDTRKPDEPCFTVQAHEDACTRVVFSPHIPNMMSTTSVDGTVRIWDILANGGTNP
jgi:WD40 repeat protein